jgi:hypothetical protein
MDDALEETLAHLAALQVADWHGLPPRMSARTELSGGAGLESSALGEDFLPTQFERLTEPRTGKPVRLWSREGFSVLVDLPAAGGEEATVPSAFGLPDAELDLYYGLRFIPGGEWIFASRGLTLVVETDSRAILHVLGWIPASVDAYVKSLRPNLEIRRRPLREPLTH